MGGLFLILRPFGPRRLIHYVAPGDIMKMSAEKKAEHLLAQNLEDSKRASLRSGALVDVFIT